MEVSGQLHTLAALTPGTQCIGGWVGPRAGLDMGMRIKKSKCVEILDYILVYHHVQED
jgi:hypothetical protein